MERRRVAIACRGGGSQCAFIAGALEVLFQRGIQERFEIAGFSGTSGGALTAAVAWHGLLKRARGDRTPPEDRGLALWSDLTAQAPQEIAIDTICIRARRLELPASCGRPTEAGTEAEIQSAAEHRFVGPA